MKLFKVSFVRTHGILKQDVFFGRPLFIFAQTVLCIHQIPAYKSVGVLEIALDRLKS